MHDYSSCVRNVYVTIVQSVGTSQSFARAKVDALNRTVLWNITRYCGIENRSVLLALIIKPSNRKESSKTVLGRPPNVISASQKFLITVLLYLTQVMYIWTLFKLGNKSGLTYAFLAQSSTATVCDKRSHNQLEVLSGKVDFNISAVNEKSTRRWATKVSLTLSSLIGPDTLVLLQVASVENLPTNPNPSLSRNYLQALPHLKISCRILLLSSKNKYTNC